MCLLIPQDFFSKIILCPPSSPSMTNGLWLIIELNAGSRGWRRSGAHNARCLLVANKINNS